MKVYIAARIEDREQAEGIKKELEGHGVEVTAAWIRIEGELKLEEIPDEKVREEERQKRLQMDLDQVKDADALVLYKPLSAHRNTTGGHHVETGYALAFGKPVFLIGTRENIFHWHPLVKEFDTANEVVAALLSLDPKTVPPAPHMADSYQAWTRTTALYPENGKRTTRGVAYCVIGGGGEAGEAAEKVLTHLKAESDRLLTATAVTTNADAVALENLSTVIRELHAFAYVAKRLEDLKRPIREGKMALPEMLPIPEATVAELVKEIGDQDWYGARLSDELGVRYSDTFAGNVKKLSSRKDRGVLHGTGDNR
jgi:nucleoside 2-deoxyribosyltransferase